MANDEDDDDPDDTEDEGLPRVRVRVDKWLWAARFFKTRRIAAEACEAGRIKIGDQALRAGRSVNLGERIDITRDNLVYEVLVLALSARRGPATEAQKLYRETDEGRARREAEQARRKAEALAGPAVKGRPTKRDRRDIERYLRRSGHH